MKTALTLPERPAGLAAALDEMKHAKSIGNFLASTAAGLRVSVWSFDAGQVQSYLLSEMGIAAIVRSEEGGLVVEFTTTQSHATVWRALRGTFRVASAMLEDGRQAMKIFTPMSCQGILDS